MPSKKINLPHDYTQFSSGYQQSLALDFPIYIAKNDPVRLLNEILEGLNYTKLYQTYSSKGRHTSVPPIIMVKIMVYAYMNRTYSSRDIEQLCQRDINFIWLLNGYPAPSHHTISRFRTERLVDGVIEDLFDQYTKVLYDLGEIKFENIFIDGSKFEANANRYSFVWKKSVLKNQEKLYEKIKKLLIEYNDGYQTNHLFNARKIVAILTDCLTELSEKVIENQIEFVYGKDIVKRSFNDKLNK